jgi:NAD(P)-dependent dehydrogenase (short-subunit alcohol dehydrogenase family)
MPTALISGASSGIGRATALRLAGSGWTVLAGVRDLAVGAALESEAATTSAMGGTVA